MQNGAEFEGISVHNFSEKILEQVVHFHVMKLSGGFFLWVGSAPVLSNLAVSMSSKYVSTAQHTFIHQVLVSSFPEIKNIGYIRRVKNKKLGI